MATKCPVILEALLRALYNQWATLERCAGRGTQSCAAYHWRGIPHMRTFFPHQPTNWQISAPVARDSLVHEQLIFSHFGLTQSRKLSRVDYKDRKKHASNLTQVTANAAVAITTYLRFPSGGSSGVSKFFA